MCKLWSRNIYNYTNIFVTSGHRHKRRKQIYLFPVLWAHLKNCMMVEKGLRQCLVMSVLYGDSHCLPAALFSSDLVSRVVFGITGECPQKVFQSSTSDILLVFA